MSDFPQHGREEVTAPHGPELALNPVKKESKKASESTHRRVEQRLIWTNIILLTFSHLLAVYSILFVAKEIKFQTWLWTFFVGGASGLGVTGGAHRLWTHRAYKAKLPLRIFLIICYAAAGHNPLFDWVRDHRVHHKYSDTDADPHNAKRGFFFSHVGWLMVKKHPDVIAKGRQIDMEDILRDPVAVFHRDYFVPMQLFFCFVLPTVVPWYLWRETIFNAFMISGVVRYVIGLNCTWLVNSAAHIWGNKPYNRMILPSENKVVSFMALGEGWHNYHHTFPQDYKTAELGNYSLNFTTFWIDFFALIGWAYDRNVPSDDLIFSTARNRGDGTFHGRPNLKGNN